MQASLPTLTDEDFRMALGAPPGTSQAIPDSSLRATSHTTLGARDRYTSSTLIGGKGGAGPSSFHTALEGQTGVGEGECKMDGCM